MAKVIDEAADQERRDLEALVKSPGWQRYVAFCAGEYSAGAQLARLDKMLDGRTEPDDQLRCVREVRCAANAVLNSTHWPLMQIRKLEASAAEVEPPLVPRRAQ